MGKVNFNFNYQSLMPLITTLYFSKCYNNTMFLFAEFYKYDNKTVAKKEVKTQTVD